MESNRSKTRKLLNCIPSSNAFPNNSGLILWLELATRRQCWDPQRNSQSVGNSSWSVAHLTFTLYASEHISCPVPSEHPSLLQCLKNVTKIRRWKYYQDIRRGWYSLLSLSHSRQGSSASRLPADILTGTCTSNFEFTARSILFAHSATSWLPGRISSRIFY